MALLESPTPSLAPQVELTPVVREFVADAVTPISAYLALAQPGASCLLESIEGTDPRLAPLVHRARLPGDAPLQRRPGDDRGNPRDR